MNLVRDTEHTLVSLNTEGVAELLQALLLRYLPVAHFGRGSGQSVQGEAPALWPPLVARCVACGSLCEAAQTVMSKLYPNANPCRPTKPCART